MAPGSPESHLTPDDKDSKNQTVAIKPLSLPTLINDPGDEFHPNSSDTGKDHGTNCFMGIATNLKFVSELMIMWCWMLAWESEYL